MNSYKILFLDIDGTIIRPDNTIEDSTKKAVSQVQQIGIEAVLATGRPIHEIADIARSLNIDSFIGYNGAYAVYRGIDLFKKPMSRESVEYFLKTAKQHKHELVMYSSTKNHLTAMDTPSMEAFKQKFHLYQNERYTSSVLDEILGMTIIASSENDASLYNTGKDVYLSQVNMEGFHHCFDVIRDNVNKGTGVHALLQKLNIPREAAIAFGDGMNDKEMLAAVGESYAMGNSTPELFSYAKNKTTDVTNSGVYNGLRSLGLLD
ncbi:HAD family phosphatase [Peribacillus cavernae]|uniref:HAD family phosphatase n=1 Tax=Peribacillus cavernae TaxID=1674310 RepID=A0A433HRY2_9BACI|nr:HAD family hydrolase [Peribacillus cavernae]MDQ0218805.1 Cof subfamily protein (haloacid dehalogenase superfamily) [Peribacillus cavernae]RUQ31014.1 HAD family phosphatase [Peribacillus cavernae]